MSQLNSPFPSYYEVNYVYFHVHPETKEIVYVGHGTNERAWRCTTNKKYQGKVASPEQGFRSSEHSEWCQNLIQQGYVPSDWVEIERRNLNKTTARELEQRFIRELRPKFNRLMGQKLLKLNKQQLEKAKKMRQNGYLYFNIADELEVSTMTVWRALNGGNKNEPAN